MQHKRLNLNLIRHRNASSLWILGVLFANTACGGRVADSDSSTNFWTTCAAHHNCPADSEAAATPTAVEADASLTTPDAGVVGSASALPEFDSEKDAGIPSDAEAPEMTVPTPDAGPGFTVAPPATAAFDSGIVSDYSTGPSFEVVNHSPMPRSLSMHALAGSGGKIYVFGGVQYRGPAYNEPEVRPVPDRGRNVDVYDPLTNLWETKGEMPIAFFSGSAESVGDQIYVVPGFTESGLPPYSYDALHVYVPANDTWEIKAPRPTATVFSTTAQVSGILYVIGGSGPAKTFADGSYNGGEPRSDINSYDPGMDSWMGLAPAPGPITGAASCVLNGRIFVFGGETENRTSIYDVATDTWSLGTPEPHKRRGHTCVRVDDSFYLFGGESLDGPLSAVLRYQPATDSWRVVGQLPEPRYWMPALALDSKIWTFGGGSASGGPSSIVDTVWEFDPKL